MIAELSCIQHTSNAFTKTYKDIALLLMNSIDRPANKPEEKRLETIHCMGCT